MVDLKESQTFQNVYSSNFDEIEKINDLKSDIKNFEKNNNRPLKFWFVNWDKTDTIEVLRYWHLLLQI